MDNFSPIIFKLIGLAVLILVIAFSCAYTVKSQTIAIIERFGRYIKTAPAGLNYKLPFVDKVVSRMSLQVYQHHVGVDTITKDKVSVHVVVAVQYNVLIGKEVEAYYKLTNPKKQIESYVFDVVRSMVTNETLDEVFNSKNSIAEAVKNELASDMAEFGYEINRALVTDIEPDAKVKKSMNEINAAQREREAANERGEADKILKIKAAEAQAEADRLRGKGIAEQRLEIMNGFRKSIEDLQSAIPSVHDKDIMVMLMLNQYLEMLERIGANSNSNVIMTQHSPGGLGSLREEIMQAILGSSSVPKTE